MSSVFRLAILCLMIAGAVSGAILGRSWGVVGTITEGLVGLALGFLVGATAYLTTLGVVHEPPAAFEARPVDQTDEPSDGDQLDELSA